MKEIWKDIEGYEGLYQVSNMGRVKSLEQCRKSCYNSVAIFQEKILKKTFVRSGYYKVALYKKHKRKDFYIHRLVAKAFIQNLDNKPAINHKDGDKSNNSADNLEWVTYKENTAHAWKTKLIVMTDERKKRNINNGLRQAKRVEQYDKKGNKIAEYNSLKEAERATGAREDGISRVCKKKQKSAGGYIWKYKED